LECWVAGSGEAITQEFFSELVFCNLIAVADTNAEKVRTISEKYNVEWYINVSKIIERKDIELIIICTPTVTHAELALEAIKAGKHVLVEKPMTNTIKEAEEVIGSTNSQKPQSRKPLRF
jgi:predicted dehydrogenase